MMEKSFVQRHHERRWGAVGFVLAGLSAVCAAGRGVSVGPLTAGMTPISAAQTAGTEAAASSGGADGVTASVSAGLPTLEQVQALRDKAAQAETPDAEAKARLLEAYDKTLAQLKLLAELQAKRAGFVQQQQAAPAEMEKAKGQLAAAGPAETPIPAGATASELESLLAAAKAALDQAQKQSATLAEEPKRRLDRRAKIPAEITAARESLSLVEQRLAALQAAQQGQTPPSETAQANLTLLRVEQAVAQARVAVIEDELKAYDATRELLAMRRDLIARTVTAAEKQVKLLEEALAEARRLEIEREQEKARQAVREARFQHPVIQTAAKENARLAGLQAELLTRIEKARADVAAADARYKKVSEQFEKIKAQITSAGQVTDVLGVLLLAERNSLPDRADLQDQIARRVAEIGSAKSAYETYDGAWSELSDPASQAAALLAEAGLGTDDPAYAQMQAELARLLGDRRSTLQALAGYSLDYAGLLSTLDSKQRLLVRLAAEYARFIDERILWVRNLPAFRPGDLVSSGGAVRWLLDPVAWGRTLRTLAVDARSHAVLYGIVLVLLVGLILPRRRLGARLTALHDRIEHRYTDRFIYTLEAGVVTLLLIAPVPLVLAFVGWRLETAEGAEAFGRVLGQGLGYAAAMLTIYGLLRFFALAEGLGSHLGFQAEPLQALRRQATWLFAALIPLAVVLTMLFRVPGHEDWKAGLGRLLFSAQPLLLLVFLAIVLRPDGCVMGPYFHRHPNGWLERLRFVSYALGLSIPLVPAVLALMGYLYAARQLYVRLVETLLLVAALLVLQACIVRWLAVVQKRMAIRRQRQRKAAARGAEAAVEPAEPVEDRLSQQAMGLVRAGTVLLFAVGVWWTWRAILPALGALEQVTLWHTTDAQGQPVVVSLGRVMVAVVILVMTVLVARNVPGLLEIVVLQRLPLDRGARFAITSLTRYGLVVVGVVLTFQKLGIGWAKVQWLIAAMTVGLGFGLQEIFANFVSGLIILFEQPVRVGDTVTVGDISGKVVRIRIRATTIRKWDQKELVVPNKEFITGRLVNWSLSDRILRLDFVVGVAYGSDIRKTEEVLYRVARAHPLVVQTDPAPRVVFQEFGDSALIFELRVYLTDMDNFLAVRHEINCAIDDAFREAGIEIAFPQCDLHLRSADVALPLRMQKPAAGES